MKVASTWTDGEPQFIQHRVDNLYSVAHLFPQAQRCGVYVLGFGDGGRYIGQSVNVVTRFGSHRRTWTDIETLDFCRCSRARLNELELRMIVAGRADEKPLRNIRHGPGPIGASDLDAVVTPDEQSAWLNDGANLDEIDGTPRVDDLAQRRLRQAKYDQMESLDSFPFVVLLLNTYVQATVPRPVMTERTFWALSAMPSTAPGPGWRRLSTLSINKMETIFVGEASEDGVTWVEAVMNVSRRALEKSFGSLDGLRAAHPKILVREDGRYEPAAGDSVGLQFTQFVAQQVFEDEAIIDAARALNLMLLRKGPTFQWRGHNYALADWVVSPLSDATIDELVGRNEATA